MASSIANADPAVLGLDVVAPLSKYGTLKKKVSAHDPKETEDKVEFEKDPMAYMARMRKKYNNKWSVLQELAPKFALMVFLIAVWRRVRQFSTSGVSQAFYLLLAGGFVRGINAIKAVPPLVPNAPGGPTFYPILGHLPFTLPRFDDLHGLTFDLLKANKFGALEMCAPGGANMIMLRDARDIEYVLRRNFRNFPNNLPPHLVDERGPGSENENLEVAGAELAGRGIFTTDGPEWAYHRKRAAHMFSANELQNRMQEVFNTHAKKFSEALRDIAKSHRVVDIQDLLASVVFDTFCDIGFSVDTKQFDEILATGEKPKFLAAFDLMQYHAGDRQMIPTPLWKLMRLLNVGMEAKHTQATKVVDDYIFAIVRKRLQNKDQAKQRDLLSLYLDEEGGDNMDEATLRDIILNFMIAGRDTTSSLLSTCFTKLSQNPEVEAKLVEKLDIQRDVAWDDVKEFAYPNAFINEGLRMNPPVPNFPRMCQEDDVLPSGQPVKSGYRVLIPMRSIGRRTDYWHNPESFNPERWMIHGENVPVKRPDEYVFPVFWGGYRLCLGKDMARAEALTFLKVVLVDYKLRIRVEPNQQLERLSNGPVHFVKHGIKARVVDEAATS